MAGNRDTSSFVQLSVKADIGDADVKRSGRSQKLNKIFEKHGI